MSDTSTANPNINQNIIELIARRYSSPSEKIILEKLKMPRAQLEEQKKSEQVERNGEKEKEKEKEVKQVATITKEPPVIVQIPATPNTPTSPSSMSATLTKLSPGNIFKNFFK
jgi:hypothetical protein